MAADRAAFLTIVLIGCGSFPALGWAQVLSNLQSAKVVGRDRLEITPGYSSGPQFGVQVATGVAEGIDLRGLYVRTEGSNLVGFGPKFTLVKDKVALALPVGFFFGQGIEPGKAGYAQPALLFTAPVNRHVEWNAAGTVLFAFSDSFTLVALNFGGGFGDLDRWAIRPEIGFLFYPGESGHSLQFSIGVTLFAGKKK
jgi:hypothetical protein